MKRIGFVGCGNISGIYFQNITGVFHDRLEIAGVCDLIPERAEQAAEQYGIQKVYGNMHELFADPTVDIVLNLTRPYEHFDVTKAALEAGKHVYTEKPLGITFEEGQELTALARQRGLLIGGAPDTFLGAGIQTCRKLIDDGCIGDIVGASAAMTSIGWETWHPDPAFYYLRGGGPMLDMGPYYITALISLMGAVKSVTGIARTTFPTRTITSEPKYGEVIPVETPTHILGMMEFASGAVGTIITSYDMHAANLPRVEIYGTKGTLSVPDPNTFGGPVLLYRPEDDKFVEIPVTRSYEENSRGLGIYDMARHLEEGAPFRASGELIHHVLEVMTGFGRAYESKGFVQMTTGVERPAPLG